MASPKDQTPAADPETEKVIGRLERKDAASRADRARWFIELQQVSDRYSPIVWGVSAGSMESWTFMLEAAECYRAGLFASALIDAHATCEQELAGRVAHRPDDAPKGWERWGLGRLVVHAKAMGWYRPATVELLVATNEYRRGIYHLRPLHAPDSLFTRTYEREAYSDKREIKMRMHEELRRNALVAIEAAFAARTDGWESPVHSESLGC